MLRARLTSAYVPHVSQFVAHGVGNKSKRVPTEPRLSGNLRHFCPRRSNWLDLGAIVANRFVICRVSMCKRSLGQRRLNGGSGLNASSAGSKVNVCAAPHLAPDLGVESARSRA